MAGSQVTIVANQIEKQRLGYQAISLTNFDNDLEPEIAQGSKVEIGEALFEFNADEPITGWAGIAADNDVWIKLTVVGAAVTASFTIVAPTWDTAKQGWYSGAERYIGGLYKDAGGDYTDKWLYGGGPEIRHGAIGDAAVRTAAIQDAAVTIDKLAAAAVSAAKIDKTLDAGGSAVIAGSGGTWTPGAGLYNWTVSDAVYMEVLQGGSWRAGAGTTSGFFLTDGTNVRLRRPAVGNVTVYYRQLA